MLCDGWTVPLVILYHLFWVGAAQLQAADSPMQLCELVYSINKCTQNTDIKEIRHTVGRSMLWGEGWIYWSTNPACLVWLSVYRKHLQCIIKPAVGIARSSQLSNSSTGGTVRRDNKGKGSLSRTNHACRPSLSAS